MKKYSTHVKTMLHGVDTRLAIMCSTSSCPINHSPEFLTMNLLRPPDALNLCGVLPSGSSTDCRVCLPRPPVRAPRIFSTLVALVTIPGEKFRLGPKKLENSTRPGSPHPVSLSPPRLFWSLPGRASAANKGPNAGRRAHAAICFAHHCVIFVAACGSIGRDHHTVITGESNRQGG